MCALLLSGFNSYRCCFRQSLQWLRTESSWPSDPLTSCDANTATQELASCNTLATNQAAARP